MVGRRALTIATAIALVLIQGSYASAEQYPKDGKAGGTLVMGISADPASLNAAASTATETQEVGKAIFESLLIDTTEGKQVPNLAESWQVSADSKTYTFKLRKDVKWHDGQPFTSADVKFTAENVWKRVHSRNRGVLANLTSVETPDGSTAVFQFSAPYGGLLASLGRYDGNIIPKHIYGDGADINTHPRNNNNPIGTGPFKFQEWVKGDHITVIKNPDYWRKGQPFAEKVVFKVLPDASARGLAIEAGDIDLLGTASVPPIPDVVRLKSAKGVVVQEYGPQKISQGQMLMFNMRRDITGKQQVRQAIAYALDKKVMVERVMQGYATVMEGPFSGEWYNDQAAVKYARDVAKANQLLDQAGYPKKADGTRFSLTLSFDSSRFASPRTSQVVQEQLKEVGITIQLQGKDRAAADATQFQTYDFDISVPAEFVGTGPDPAAGIRAWYHTSAIGVGTFNNGARYSNPAVDKALDDASKEADPAKRKAIFAQMAQVVTTELPYVWLMAPKRVVLYRDTWTNLAWTDPYELDYGAAYQKPVGGPATPGAAGGSAGDTGTTAAIAGAVIVVLAAAGFVMLRRRSA